MRTKSNRAKRKRSIWESEEQKHQLDSLRISDRNGGLNTSGRLLQDKEEERLICQKLPLQKKLAGIIYRCGIKSIGNDVERCLSLAVKERMDGLIRNMIKMSKLRVDPEKSGHQIVVSSDIQKTLPKLNVVGRTEITDMDKDIGCSKTPEDNKSDEAIRNANNFVRTATGGEDLISKWQLMSKKLNEGLQTSSSAQPSEDTRHVSSQTSGRTTEESREFSEKGTETQTQGDRILIRQMKLARSLSVKDAIAVLEREPQMSRSTFLYRLYKKI